MSDKVQLLAEADIFDIYAAQELLHRAQTDQRVIRDDDYNEIKSRVYQVHRLYVNSAKERIRAEAVFLGVRLNSQLSFEDMLQKVKEILAVRLTSSAGPVNLMQEILRAHQMAGSKAIEGVDLAAYGVRQQAEPDKKQKEVDPDWFLKGNKNLRMWDNPKWHEIARAYLSLEQADQPMAMILAIDYLNSLQHNSFHLLVDLQSGRMLDSTSEGVNFGNLDLCRRNVQRVLDICLKKQSVYSFLDEVSPAMRTLLNRYK